MGRHGKTKSHKKQHYVPRCYLKAWHDPAVPPGGRITPYVWHFEKDGNNSRAKAPANIFTETDIYTIERADGDRDLRLEHGLQGIEDQFTRIRNLRFSRREWPDAEQFVWVLAFVASAQVRTAAMRDFQARQWGDMRQKMERIEQAYREAGPERRKRMSVLGPPPGAKETEGMGIEDLRQVEQNPIRFMLVPALQAVMPIMARMHVAVLCTEDPLGFVTTDKPCTWFNPEGHKLPPLYRSPGLAMRSIEVTLPISPRQCLLISHNPDFTGYIDIEPHVVDELNRRHIAHCDSAFIACRNETRPVWFEHRPLPEDAWEVVHAEEIAKRKASGAAADGETRAAP